MAQLVCPGIAFQLSPVLYGQLNVVYLVCSVFMIYLTAYRSTTLCFLFLMIGGPASSPFLRAGIC